MTPSATVPSSAPELIWLDEWGYPVLDPRPVPAHLEAAADRAIRAVPLAEALSWRRPATAAGPPAER